MAKKYFIFDTETGGLPTTNPMPTLLTLYGVITDNNLEVLNEIHLKIKPENKMYIINSVALEINNIDLRAHNKEADDYLEASKDLHNFLKNHSSQEEKIVPAGQNINFDISFTKKLINSLDFPYCKWEDLVSRRVYDIPSVVYFLIQQGKLPEDLQPSLNSLASYFGISYDGAHNEKFDVELTIQILKQLLKI